jgi:hypothetical protein
MPTRGHWHPCVLQLTRDCEEEVYCTIPGCEGADPECAACQRAMDAIDEAYDGAIDRELERRAKETP